MQVAKEMNVMFATKKIMSLVRNLVAGLPLAALLVIVGMAGTAAARPVVVSTIPGGRRQQRARKYHRHSEL